MRCSALHVTEFRPATPLQAGALEWIMRPSMSSSLSACLLQQPHDMYLSADWTQGQGAERQWFKPDVKFKVSQDRPNKMPCKRATAFSWLRSFIMLSSSALVSVLRIM